MGDEFDAGSDHPGDAVTTGAETATMDQLLELAAALPPGPASATPTGSCREGGC